MVPAASVHLAYVLAEITNGDGRVSALADASVMLLPHRRWVDLAPVTDEPDELATGPQDVSPGALSTVARGLRRSAGGRHLRPV